MLRRHYLSFRSVEVLQRKQIENIIKNAAETYERYVHVIAIWHADVRMQYLNAVAIDRGIQELPNHWSSESRLFSTPRVGGSHIYGAMKKSDRDN